MKTNTTSTFASQLIITAALVASFVPALAFAKTDIMLSSAPTTVTVGQTFTVAITVTANTETAYTPKVVIAYPAALVEVTSFSFAPSWLALSQAGYDAIDNVAGTITKTAGYPDGISSGTSKLFGTITFTAKANGVATVNVAHVTQVYDSQNTNIFSGAEHPIQISIETAPAVVSPVAAEAPAQPTAQNTQVAAAGSTGTSSGVYTLTTLAIALVLAAIVYGIWSKKNSKKNARQMKK